MAPKPKTPVEIKDQFTIGGNVYPINKSGQLFHEPGGPTVAAQVAEIKEIVLGQRTSPLSEGAARDIAEFLRLLKSSNATLNLFASGDDVEFMRGFLLRLESVLEKPGMYGAVRHARVGHGSALMELLGISSEEAKLYGRIIGEFETTYSKLAQETLSVPKVSEVVAWASAEAVIPQAGESISQALVNAFRTEGSTEAQVAARTRFYSELFGMESVAAQRGRAGNFVGIEPNFWARQGQALQMSEFLRSSGIDPTATPQKIARAIVQMQRGFAVTDEEFMRLFAARFLKAAPEAQEQMLAMLAEKGLYDVVAKQLESYTQRLRGTLLTSNYRMVEDMLAKVARASGDDALLAEARAELTRLRQGGQLAIPSQSTFRQGLRHVTLSKLRVAALLAVVGLGIYVAVDAITSENEVMQANRGIGVALQQSDTTHPTWLTVFRMMGVPTTMDAWEDLSDKEKLVHIGKLKEAGILGESGDLCQDGFGPGLFFQVLAGGKKPLFMYLPESEQEIIALDFFNNKFEKLIQDNGGINNTVLTALEKELAGPNSTRYWFYMFMLKHSDTIFGNDDRHVGAGLPSSQVEFNYAMAFGLERAAKERAIPQTEWIKIREYLDAEILPGLSGIQIGTYTRDPEQTQKLIGRMCGCLHLRHALEKPVPSPGRTETEDEDLRIDRTSIEQNNLMGLYSQLVADASNPLYANKWFTIGNWEFQYVRPVPRGVSTTLPKELEGKTVEEVIIYLGKQGLLNISMLPKAVQTPTTPQLAGFKGTMVGSQIVTDLLGPKMPQFISEPEVSALIQRYIDQGMSTPEAQKHAMDDIISGICGEMLSTNLSQPMREFYSSTGSISITFEPNGNIKEITVANYDLFDKFIISRAKAAARRALKRVE